MSLFDFFKKKTVFNIDKHQLNVDQNNQIKNCLNDISFIQDIKHISQGPWHQYDILLAAKEYGWDFILEWADYMASDDLYQIQQVTVAPIAGEKEKTLQISIIITKTDATKFLN